MPRPSPGLRLTYSITYDIVTPESAENGDVAERGFILPGGHQLPIEDGMTGQRFIDWTRNMGVDIEFRDLDEGETLIDVVVETLRHEGVNADESSGHSFYGYPEQDYRTGEETTRCVHLCDDFEEDELAEIRRRLRGGR